jgi:hypothetical protein
MATSPAANRKPGHGSGIVATLKAVDTKSALPVYGSVTVPAFKSMLVPTKYPGRAGLAPSEKLMIVPSLGKVKSADE